MKIISWNVNGIRAVAKKGLASFLEQESPDILGLQEIKISADARSWHEFDFKGYQEFWFSAKRPGYSGTMFLIKEGIKFIGVVNGWGEEKFDSEGRVQTLELEDFYLLNVYFPNANDALSRLGYKLEFNQQMLKYVKRLEKKKAVIVSGDFNVAHEEIDLARPKENAGSSGFTPEERAWFSKLLAAGLVDSFRLLNGQKIQYSWWSYRAGARARNVGWRIDYFVLSAKLSKRIKRAFILDKVTGSDHAPIGLEL